MLSPPELVSTLRTVIVAPLEVGGRRTPFRASLRHRGADAVIALERIETIAKSRLLHRAGKLAPSTLRATLALLARYFAP